VDEALCECLPEIAIGFQAAATLSDGAPVELINAGRQFLSNREPKYRKRLIWIFELSFEISFPLVSRSKKFSARLVRFLFAFQRDHLPENKMIGNRAFRIGEVISLFSEKFSNARLITPSLR
jgi:hypothetical protein